MNNSLNTYGYNTDVDLVSSCEQMHKYLDEKFNNINVNVDKETIQEAIHDEVTPSLEEIKVKIDDTNVHMDVNKCQIINEIDKNGCGCLCHLATKDDIKYAVCKINNNTNKNFTENNFQEQFNNLNDHLEEISNKLNK